MTKQAVASGRPAAASNPLRGALLDHVLIFVHDFDRMLRFHRDTLGFKMRYGNDHFAELSSAEARESGSTPEPTRG
ncbi:MAG: VOC family protein [Thermoplasmata archaeon]|nr:VOC family protein [Thermoplasmata archaeon]